MKVFATKLKICNTTLLLQLIVLLEKHHKLNYELHNELGLESLKFRRWISTCMFYKIKTLNLTESFT